MDPKATGAVLARRQMADALKAEKPNPLSMVAAIATGVPNPAAPSRNAPKANAINKACRRGSGVRRPIESRIISNLPVSVVTRKSAMAQKMIQEIGKRPNVAP